MRVLLVEDEVRLAENIACALREGPGFAVDCAFTGHEGADLAGNGCYDLIILRPDAAGYQWTQCAKENPGSQETATPVLILTARSETSSTITLLNAGADDYLRKPFDLGELLARVKALVRRGKGIAHPTLHLATWKSIPSNKQCGAAKKASIFPPWNTAFLSTWFTALA